MEKKKVMMLGSFVVDLTTRQKGLPVPGETIVGDSFKMGPGGKGSNQATAASRAGGEVVMVTKTGNDTFRSVCTDHYAREQMTDKYVYSDPNEDTGTAIIEVHEKTAENRIIVMKAANDHLTPAEVDAAEEEFRTCDAVLLQLESNFDAIREAIALAKKYGKPIVMNPAPAQKVPEGFFDGIDYFTPNETEAEFFSGIVVKDEESAFTAGRKMIAEQNVGCVIITLGKKGAAVVKKDLTMVVPTTDLKPIDTTGAGDAFNGGLTVALAEKRDIEDAVKFANCVASISVTRQGSSPAMPHRDEVEELYRNYYGK